MEWRLLQRERIIESRGEEEGIKKKELGLKSKGARSKNLSIYKITFIMQLNKERNERIAYETEFFRFMERDQEMFDGRTELFERVEQVPVGCVFPYIDGKVMIARQKQPHKPERYFAPIWWVIWRDENHETWTRRELLEETWSEWGQFHYIGNYRSGWSKIWRNKYYYVCRSLEKVADVALDPGGEILEPVRVSLEEFVDLLVHSKVGCSGLREYVMRLMIDNELHLFTDLFTK